MRKRWAGQFLQRWIHELVCMPSTPPPGAFEKVNCIHSNGLESRVAFSHLREAVKRVPTELIERPGSVSYRRRDRAWPFDGSAIRGTGRADLSRRPARRATASDM